jgi:hypothetical protein
LVEAVGCYLAAVESPLVGQTLAGQ